MTQSETDPTQAEINPDHICPICLGLIIVPVWIQFPTCGCNKRRYYCLTCFRDLVSAGNSGLFNKMCQHKCPLCREDNNSTYTVDVNLIKQFDQLYGPQRCPRGCSYQCFQKDMHKHLYRCPLIKRFKCVVCYTTHDLPTFTDCLNRHWNSISSHGMYSRLYRELIKTMVKIDDHFRSPDLQQKYQMLLNMKKYDCCGNSRRLMYTPDLFKQHIMTLHMIFTDPQIFDRADQVIAKYSVEDYPWMVEFRQAKETFVKSHYLSPVSNIYLDQTEYRQEIGRWISTVAFSNHWRGTLVTGKQIRHVQTLVSAHSEFSDLHVHLKQLGCHRGHMVDILKTMYNTYGVDPDGYLVEYRPE